MLLSIRRLADIARAKFVFVHTFPLNPSSAAPAEQVGSPGFGAARVRKLGCQRFTSRQPMSSWVTASAGQQKKAWGRRWEVAGRAWWLWEWLE